MSLPSPLINSMYKNKVVFLKNDPNGISAIAYKHVEGNETFRSKKKRKKKWTNSKLNRVIAAYCALCLLCLFKRVNNNSALSQGPAGNE